MKKSFIKTVEILLVIIITTILAISIIQRQEKINSQESKKNYLINLEKNIIFRQFVLENNGCFNSTDLSFPITQKSVLCIESITDIRTNFYFESLFLTGNETKLKFKTVRLYTLE